METRIMLKEISWETEKVMISHMNILKNYYPMIINPWALIQN